MSSVKRAYEEWDTSPSTQRAAKVISESRIFRKSPKRIYVVCPKGVKTGGTELLHQLCYELNSNGNIDASMAYVETKQSPTIHPSFRKYVSSFEFLNEISDSDENLLIFPEVYTSLLQKFSKSQTAIWWLSVDNFKLQFDLRLKLQRTGFLRTIKLLFMKKNFKYTDLAKSADVHFYQSEYAKNYISELGIPDDATFYLSDYLNESFLKQCKCLELSNERKDRILYNPAKGYKFTKRLIKSAPNYEWVPLKGYSNDELIDLFVTSKLYVDFGWHPGKDRLPREAAACGCCILVGSQGSAAFYADMPIPDWAKLPTDSSIPEIVKTIEWMLAEYNSLIDHYSTYRTMIVGERERFAEDVVSIFWDNKTHGY